MHLLIQPVLMRQLLTDPLAQGQGLIARMLTAQPQTLAGTRLWKEPTSQEASAITAYNATMRDLLSRQPTYFEGGDGHELKPHDLPFDEAASAAWKAFYNQVEVAQGTGRELEAARPWASKAAEQAARISAVITMVQDPQAHSVGLDVSGKLGEAQCGGLCMLPHGLRMKPCRKLKSRHFECVRWRTEISQTLSYGEAALLLRRVEMSFGKSPERKK